MNYKVARYGWLPDLPDHRDQLYAAPAEIAGALSASVDLRTQCPPVYDQGQLGSCTANAVAAAIQFDQMKQKLTQIFTPARLFIYYNERVIEHIVDSDNGAQVAKTGHASLPKSDEQSIGGHAVMCVGYDDAKQWFIVRNSWGDKWGMKGYFTLPYSYLISANLASDFWTI